MYEGITILEDSRQQTLSHEIKHKWFVEHGIFVNRTKLTCGDYQLPSDGSIAIDTKANLLEISSNIQVKTMGKKAILEDEEEEMKF